MCRSHIFSFALAQLSFLELPSCKCMSACARVCVCVCAFVWLSWPHLTSPQAPRYCAGLLCVLQFASELQHGLVLGRVIHVLSIWQSYIGQKLLRFETNKHSNDNQKKKYDETRARHSKFVSWCRCCPAMKPWKESTNRPSPDTEDEILIHLAITELKLDELRNNLEVLLTMENEQRPHALDVRHNAYFLDGADDDSAVLQGGIETGSLNF